jgi:hypothetical protein
MSFTAGLDLDGRLERVPDVTSRVARLSYGVCFFEPFDETFHDPRDRQLHDHSGKDMAVNQMHWYLKRVISCFSQGSVVPC